MSSQTELKKEVKGIRDNSVIKLKNNQPMSYHIIYDTFSQTLEPVYFWTLDFLRADAPSGLGLEVEKIEEEFEASAGSGYYGELGARASAMQDRAMAILRQVNAIIKEIVNLIYDLKEYEMRLETYNNIDPKKQSDSDERKTAELSLRSIWMDQVDIKKGVGSINNLTRGDLQFVTLRDAFMQAKDIKDAKKLDLNKRVKSILEKKLAEYFQWRDYSEKELRKRYSIEKNYLRSQIDSLKLYTKWARPYLRASQKLGMKEIGETKLPNPDIVAAFNNMQMELSLFAKKEIKPSEAFPEYSKFEFDDKYYACLQVDFKYRTVPQSVKSGQSTHYAHLGTVDVYFTAYAMTDKEIGKVEKEEVFEDMALVEHLTDISLKDLQDDIDKYLGEDEKPKEEKKEPFPNPFKGLSEMIKPIKIFKRKAGKYEIEKVKEAAKSTAKQNCLVIYDVFKKAHRMMTW
tara:strand:- start:293 stop:1666 length:1374 start_codon:yes stop_codon:yes gene_type:complete